VYVKGLLVAEEPNFLFSYNVTRLSAALRRALNRERSNVGRGAEMPWAGARLNRRIGAGAGACCRQFEFSGSAGAIVAAAPELRCRQRGVICKRRE
jgi:hypothetical protein